jgi:peptidoglycan/xylan/chitin deacetylase (PgdA/CDA1 family)
MSRKKKSMNIKVILLFSLAVLLLFSSLAIYSNIFAETYLREKEPFSFDFSDITYTKEDTHPKEIPNVEILPSNYEDITEKLGDIDRNSKTELLRYSQTLQKGEFNTLAEAYTYLNDKNISAVIPQEYIDIYIISRIQKISGILESKVLPSKISTAMKFQTKEYTQLDICKNTEEENIPEDCSVKTARLENDELQNTTLSVLYNWILFTDYNTESGYEKYIHKQLQKFSLNTDTAETNTSENTVLPKNIYWDTDIVHLKKLKYLLEYTEQIYKQSKVKDNEIDILLKENSDILNNLISGSTDSPDTFLQNILSLSAMNTKQENDIYLDWKVEGDLKIHILPMYIYSRDKEYNISDTNFNEEYEYTPVEQRSGTVRVPILMYHQIADVPAGSSFRQGLYVTPETFEKQMAYLVKMNYKSITTKELYNLLSSGKNPSQKTVVITFDDSIRNQYTEAYPILKKYGLTGVFFVVSNKSGIKYTELKEMSDSGMEIGSHTATHIDLTKEKNDTAVRDEIFNSKGALQYAAGKTVYSIAYPGCVADSRSFSYTSGAGYLIGMSCGKSIDHIFRSRLSLSRVHVFNDMTSFIKLLSGIN